MRLLIIGSNRKSGHIVSLYLKERGHYVDCFEQPQYICNSLYGDTHDHVFIKHVVENGDYNAIVYCDAIINNNAEEDKAEAAFINAYLPHYLEFITKGTKTKVIMISTDCVYSGTKGNYVETDRPDGESFYARSKALGEIYNEKDYTIRTSLIGPDINYDGIGLLNWFMKQKGSVKGFSKAIWTGITTLELAKIVEQICIQDVNGMEHLVPDHPISKLELLNKFNYYFRDREFEIISDDSLISDKSLIRTRKLLNYMIPDYDIMLQELKEWMEQHKDLYPHYYK